MHLVINPRQVGRGGSLADATEFVVHRTVAQTHPALVSTEVGHGDAAQVGANGRAAHDGRVACIRNADFAHLVKLGRWRKRVGLIDFRLGKTSDENDLTVPGGLEHLTGGQLRNVELLVGIANVPIASDHLVVDNREDGLEAEHVAADHEALEHVDLGTLDLVLAVLLIPESKPRHAFG